MAGNSMDDNCDGNVDDLLNTRTEPELFEYDLVGPDGSDNLFDFEGHLVEMMAVIVFTGGHVWIGSVPCGAQCIRNVDPGSLGGQVYNDGVTNQLRMYFNPSIEAIGFYIWIQMGLFHWRFWVAIHRPRRRDLMADNIPGGAFGVFTATPVDYLVLDGELGDGFGIDSIEVVWTTYTDSDLDGFTEAVIVMTQSQCQSRCAWEPANGIDDDCDGAVDGGAESFDDLQTFEDTWNRLEVH